MTPLSGPAGLPPLPGMTALSRIDAYDTVSPDGLRGGTPHVHLACTECYIVLRGQGSLQLLGPHGYQEVELRPGAVVWFEPGIVHRDINADGRLQFLALMENAGLPEAGDQVMTFPPEVLDDPAAYRSWAALPDDSVDRATIEDKARRRRDLAVDGFAALRRDVDERGTAALEDFYGRARRLVAADVDRWRDVWGQRISPHARDVETRLDAVEEGSCDLWMRAGFGAFPDGQTAVHFGMCGMLTPLNVDEAQP